MKAQFMHGEIRDIFSGIYCNDDDCCLEIAKHDDGVVITLVDYDVETYWMFVIDENGCVIDSHIGSIFEEEETE